VAKGIMPQQEQQGGGEHGGRRKPHGGETDGLHQAHAQGREQLMPHGEMRSAAGIARGQHHQHRSGGRHAEQQPQVPGHAPGVSGVPGRKSKVQ